MIIFSVCSFVRLLVEKMKDTLKILEDNLEDITNTNLFIILIDKFNSNNFKLMGQRESFCLSTSI